ncbi:MAG: hypothetical protein LBK27_01960 [Treponema sp.]|jgi:hypothetical protein|nr:hypothetical protein [Treponema sp.]
MKFSAGLLILLVFFGSCSSRTEQAQAGAASFTPVPLALIEAGENPLWFELAEDGPRQIAFPDEAGLSPFAPWPLARHIRAIYPWGALLIFGVNRDGLLIFAPPNAEEPAPDRGIALYRFADAAYWGQYTLAALFPFGESMAALLYRDDFFAGPELPLPSPRIFSIWPDEPESPELRPMNLPAFDSFPAEEGWNLDTLRFGHDGRWYYRAVRKDAAAPEIVHYRTDRLTNRGEAVSPGDFQNSALPEPANTAPAPLRAVLEAAFAQSPGDGLATVIFPDRRSPRYFSAGGFPGGKPSGGATVSDSESGGGTAEAGSREIAGFYREPTVERPGAALAIFPNGRGFFSVAPAGSAAAPRPLTLPALPPGFAYTSAALCGDTLIAAWEEQKDYSIGAAGFMIIRFTENGKQP